MKKYSTYLLGILVSILFVVSGFNKMGDAFDPLWKILILILALFLNVGFVFLILFIRSFYKYIGILLMLVGVGFIQSNIIEDQSPFLIDLFITVSLVVVSIGGLFFILFLQKPIYRYQLSLIFLIVYFYLSFLGLMGLIIHPEIIAMGFYVGLSGLLVPLYFLAQNKKKIRSMFFR